MTFQDHFSSLARQYADHRPGYPSELFASLASLAPNRDTAWDCGTGNGQAAVELAKHFSRVVATDGSAEQIARAFPHKNIDYRVEPADRMSLQKHSIDLVTVATAVHYFPLEGFYGEVHRVLRPGGIIAVWTYHLPLIDDRVDAVLARFYHDIVGSYWPEGIEYAYKKYKTLPFPFEGLDFPSWTLEASWDMNGLLGFLSSWSATGRYLAAKNKHPLELILRDLEGAWGEPAAKKTIRWPLYMRVGRVARKTDE